MGFVVTFSPMYIMFFDHIYPRYAFKHYNYTQLANRVCWENLNYWGWQTIGINCSRVSNEGRHLRHTKIEKSSEQASTFPGLQLAAGERETRLNIRQQCMHDPCLLPTLGSHAVTCFIFLSCSAGICVCYGEHLRRAAHTEANSLPAW